MENIQKILRGEQIMGLFDTLKKAGSSTYDALQKTLKRFRSSRIVWIIVATISCSRNFVMVAIRRKLPAPCCYRSEDIPGKRLLQ